MHLPLAFASFAFFTALGRGDFLVARGPHWLRRAWNGTDQLSTWGGPTRPRPFDEPWYPKTLLYDTGKVIDRYEYDKP